MRVESGYSDAKVGVYTCGRDTSPQPSGMFIIDVAGLRDPQSNRNFRKLYSDGRAGAVQSYVKEDPRFEAIRDQILYLIHDAKSSDPNKWISFILRDHHGTWIAPAIGELVAEAISAAGYPVSVVHYELTAQAAGGLK